MQFQSIAEEIKYLYKQIIFTYIRNKHLYYLELGNNGVFHEKNRIIVRCDKDEFIKQYIKELFPAPEIQLKIYSFSNWYLIDFGVRIAEGLSKQHNYMTTSEIIELIYKNPMKYFVTYNLWSVYLWLPHGLEDCIGLTEITAEQKEALSVDPQWTWTGDVFTIRNEEIAVKCLRAYMRALDHMLSLETNAVRLGY